MNESLITQSLELVGERCEDPTPQVYQRLFAANPEMEPLFMLDKNDAAKGQMLFQVIESILDFVGTRSYSHTLIVSELINHRQIGVPPEVFSTFFTTVMETFRDILGGDWTPEFDQAWADMLKDLDVVLAEQA